MTREEKYDAVNSCETLIQLSQVIKSFADNNGEIQGRTKKFNAEEMAFSARNFQNFSPNVLTREFGIRQQAMYITYYLK